MMCRSYAAWFVWFVICPMAARAYGVLVIGYYCGRGYAAFLPLCGIFRQTGGWAIKLMSGLVMFFCVWKLVLGGRAERAPLLLCGVIGPSAQQPVCPSA